MLTSSKIVHVRGCQNEDKRRQAIPKEPLTTIDAPFGPSPLILGFRGPEWHIGQDHTACTRSLDSTMVIISKGRALYVCMVQHIHCTFGAMPRVAVSSLWLLGILLTLQHKVAHVARRGPWLSSWSFKASSPMPVWSRAPSQTSTKGTPGFETRQVFLGATTVCGASQLIKPETAAARGSVADHSRSYWMSD